ncbi:MAG: hypothetical protein KDC35_17230 [Acidobacteria bacterium]|nr:hypothetical protein [Acidobacteriota bacterium]
MTKRVQIYIKPEDQVFFDKARSIYGGNMSSAVAKAVRHYVQTVERKDALGFRVYYAVCVNGDVHAGVQHDGHWRFLHVAEPQIARQTASFLEVGLFKEVPRTWQQVESCITSAFQRHKTVACQTRRQVLENGIVEWRSDPSVRPIQTREQALEVARAIFILMEASAMTIEAAS